MKMGLCCKITKPPVVVAQFGREEPHRTLRIISWPIGGLSLPFLFLLASAALQVSLANPGFTLLSPAQTGVAFTNYLPAQRHLTNQILPNGSGVAAGDVDGDGWCDLFFCGLDSGSRLYRNLQNWKFEEITARAGVRCDKLDVTGAALVDLEGDRDLDLVVNSLGGGTHLFLNDARGRFTRRPEVLNANRAGTSLAFADVDGDGRLDLYIANYRVSSLTDAPDTRFSVKMVNNQPMVTAVNGKPITDPELANRFNFKFTMEGGRGKFAHEENGEPDAFFRNVGEGRFEPLAFAAGRFLDQTGAPLPKPPFDWGLSVMFRDLDHDGDPDIYVCNDFSSPDRVWLNDGKGVFRAMSSRALRQTSLSSMAVDFADLNRDGFAEFFVADMLTPDHRRRLTQHNLMRLETSIESTERRPQSQRNTLFLNRGDGTYAEVAQFSGLEASEWSWASIFIDVDLDGYEDLLVANGFIRDNLNLDALRQIEAAKSASKLSPLEQLHLRKMFPTLATPNLAFRNLGTMRFQEVSAKWGFNTVGISQGMCLADLDNDGDLDVAVNNLNSAAGIYRNESSAPRVAVRLNGLAPNTRGIGAKIRVLGGAVPMQSQEMICGGRYLSSDDPIRTFAAGTSTNEMRIEVKWRSGKKTVINGAIANRIYEIEETAAEPEALNPPAQIKPAFKDVSQLVNHTHHDEEYDDFARQPLLPKKLSRLGPGVAWADLDADHWEDIVIGSGKGGSLAVFRNDAKGGFQETKQFAQALTRDLTGLLVWNPRSTGTVVLAASSHYEDGLPRGAGVRQFDPTRKILGDLLPATESSSGPLAMADIDADGDLDLFVGGRVIPGKYPQPATSRLFLNESEEFRLHQEFSGVGLVSGALWSDLDNDGYAELIIACEWGPIRIFRNARGKLTEATSDLKMNQYLGWWNGVSTGDFDGDGLMDIVASNWGQNSKYERYRSHPLVLYYGDFNYDGSTQLIDSYREPSMKREVPLRLLDAMAKAIPRLTERFPTHRSYSEAPIEEVLAEDRKAARKLEANWLENTVFLNRRDHFEPRVLPMEAQLAPAFAVCVADYDGDGNEDIFLSQNFFAVEPETSRYDAGRGLWLQGDGKGSFRPLSATESGVELYGEQRGAALCDYDKDARVDLIVTQNAAETKLFRNVSAKPGLRVRLSDPQGSRGAGAVLRLKYGEQFGPAREIHLGSGYWSQDSAVAVLGKAAEPSALWVRWAGGTEIAYRLPQNAAEVEVNPAGELKQ